MAGVPSMDRTWELMERAYPDGDMIVLGWADNSVVYEAQPEPVTHNFTVYPEVQRSHEDEVLIVAIIVPHPDLMPLEEVIG